jgi:hypothetical protein
MDTKDPSQELETIDVGEYETVRAQIERIDADPDHHLPEGVTAVIKLGAWHSAKATNFVSGQIWYDKARRFQNGYMIQTSPIVKRENGIVTTTAGYKYLVHFITAYKETST